MINQPPKQRPKPPVGVGGRREGAGRKTAVRELEQHLDLKSVLDRGIDRNKRIAIVKKLGNMALAGDMRAIELAMAYLYGKPRQEVDLQGGLEITGNLTITEIVVERAVKPVLELVDNTDAIDAEMLGNAAFDLPIEE